MKIFINSKIKNISIVLTVAHAWVLMYTPGPWSADPKEAGFWLAIVSSVASTIFVNKMFVIFAGKPEKK